MTSIQAQGVHHITMIGSNRQATVDFYQGVLGMPLIFSQPNLDVPEEEHLYFDMGDGNLLTFFVRTTRPENDSAPNPEGIGNLHHLAFTVSQVTYNQITDKLNAMGIENTGPVDRGFMWSIYFRDPNGQLIELAYYKFEVPQGSSRAEVLNVAHNLRVKSGDYAIEDKHLAEAINQISKRMNRSFIVD